LQELNDLENEILERQNIEKRLRRELLTHQKKKTTSLKPSINMSQTNVKTVSHLKSSIANEKDSINRLKNSVAKLKRAVSELKRNNIKTTYKSTIYKPTVYKPMNMATPISIATPITIQEERFTEQDVENIEPMLEEEPQIANAAEPLPINNNSPYVSSSIDRITDLPPSYQSFQQPNYVLEPTSLPVNEKLEKEDLSYR
jgi:hypothetical protein